MMAVIKDLQTITTNVLSSLGEPTMQALYWELSTQGVSTNPEEFDIKKFDHEMKKIFGDGANVFMDEIYARFKEKAEREYVDKKQIDEINDESLPAIEKILKILSLKVST
ncbi:MAG: hypothetical protein ACREBU_14020 [Nitrososphaera sp.]